MNEELSRKVNMKNIITSLFIFISLATINAQNPGLVIYGGLSAMASKDKTITPSGHFHYGWLAGADVRLLDGDLYFLIGGQYQKSSIFSSSSPDFFSKRDLTLANGRLGMGFNIVHFSERVALRSKLLASINFVMEGPKEGLNKPGYNKLNDSFLGGVTGLGLTLGAFDFDLEYQYGVINAFYQQKNSTFSGISLLAGFHF
ncbi:MAG: hypothetical protein UZ09_BCD002001914 [Bacteroidetes bacterium OLB9]|nr:MAG: hypothetical protein UZ09_BCD002001914 [Bacteroidetes bacterium OLB9]